MIKQNAEVVNKEKYQIFIETSNKYLTENKEEE